MSVKRRLTVKRERELPEYCSMVRRVLRAHGRRVGGVTRQAAQMTWGRAVEELEHAETRAMSRELVG